MSDYIHVNGAKIEKEFFEANVREAKSYNWARMPANALAKHVHCTVCGVAMGPESLPTTGVYRSKGGYLCVFCYENFMK